MDGAKGPALCPQEGRRDARQGDGISDRRADGRRPPHARLFNWDKMWVPLPLSRIVYFFTGPFWVPKNTDKAGLEKIRSRDRDAYEGNDGPDRAILY